MGSLLFAHFYSFLTFQYHFIPDNIDTISTTINLNFLKHILQLQELRLTLIYTHPIHLLFLYLASSYHKTHTKIHTPGLLLLLLTYTAHLTHKKNQKSHLNKITSEQQEWTSNALLKSTKVNERYCLYCGVDLKCLMKVN